MKANIQQLIQEIYQQEKMSTIFIECLWNKIMKGMNKRDGKSYSKGKK